MLNAMILSIIINRLISGGDGARRRAPPLLQQVAGTFALVLLCVLMAAPQLQHKQIQMALAYPSGAPDSACKDLKPGHGVEASSSSSPFELTQDKLQVEAGDQIKGK